MIPIDRNPSVTVILFSTETLVLRARLVRRRHLPAPGARPTTRRRLRHGTARGDQVRA